jgi:hypothetical protein
MRSLSGGGRHRQAMRSISRSARRESSNFTAGSLAQRWPFCIHASTRVHVLDAITDGVVECRTFVGPRLLTARPEVGRTRNLCVGALLEAVRDRTNTVDLKQVNGVLLQPITAQPGAPAVPS